jgi:short-subunit dehydrogenase
MNNPAAPRVLPALHFRQQVFAGALLFACRRAPYIQANGLHATAARGLCTFRRERTSPMSPSRQNPGTALVTGAAGRLGSAYAERLAQRGHDVILVGRDRERLQAVASRITARSTGRAEVLVADLRAKRDLIAVEGRLAKDPGIRMLVTTSGPRTHAGGPDRHRQEVMQQLDAVALRMLSRAAAPAFVARGGGTIVSVAPSAAMRSGSTNADPGVTRSFVVSLSESLYQELGGKGLRVQAVLPITAEQGEACAEDVVDAALEGLDRHERLTVPALPGRI